MIFGTFVCLLLLVEPISLIVVPVSNAQATQTFRAAVNLSNDAAIAKWPAVSNNGQNVYVAWSEGSGGIFFRVSTNGGAGWTPSLSSPALKISIAGGVAQFPVMFTQYQSVPSGHVYTSWAQTVSGVLQIFVATSSNNGLSFRTTQVSAQGGITPSIAAWGSDVYVVWYQQSGCSSNAGGGCIAVASSTNDGQTWGAPVQLNPSTRGEPQIVASGSSAYVIADGIYFEASYDNGAHWSRPTVVYPFTPPSSFGREPWIAASGSNVYITWNANSSVSPYFYRAYGRTSHDGGRTWSPPLTSLPQILSGSVRNDWEPENAAYGSTAFLTFHAFSNQGIYMTRTTNTGNTWSTPVLVSPTGRQASYAHVFTSDGVNVFVMWGQAIAAGASTWAAYVSYSGNSGSSWSTPINISHNNVGVAAGYNDVTLLALSSNGVHCFAAWTYTVGTTSQIYFASS